ncbi:MAG: selenocysteine-specific translation elongation factor [Planctomycetota bacterium]|nr:MAG: selenocysteine-specific translation elongation factor [Planctomycetota bacterium]
MEKSLTRSSKIYNVVIGTAGHIDHGKTSLVRALTGIDADRLREEKERGLTIDLGFAPLILPDGTKVGIIDVPGHERFIKNMVAGATGIDIVILVVAADDSVMPQTKEHLDIMTLLGISKGLVALTKIDLVDQDIVELAKEEIRELTENTFLSEAPIFPLSTVTGEGVEEFRQALFEAIQSCPPRSALGPFRMPIQRVFAAKGHGTVVTGVPMSGMVKLGDMLEIQPHGFSGKVRKIQAYKEEIEVAHFGHSTALNLSDIDYKQVSRGDVVCEKGYFAPSKIVEAKFHYLPHFQKPLKSYREIKFHVGTKEGFGKILIMGKKEILPGEWAYIQILLEEEVVAGMGDPFILRRSSPAETLGGGRVLGISKERKKTGRPEVLPYFQKKEKLIKTPKGRILWAFWERKDFLKEEELLKSCQLARHEFEKAFEELNQEDMLVYWGKRQSWTSREVLEQVKGEIVEILQNYHAKEALSLGMETKELLKTLNKGELGKIALEELENEGVVRYSSSEQVSLSSFNLQIDTTTKNLISQILSAFNKNLFSPPGKQEVLEGIKKKRKEGEQAFRLLVQQGELIPLENLYFSAKAVQEAKKKLSQAFPPPKTWTASEAREVLSTSRKYLIPLLEYLDKQGFSKREGSHRVILEPVE